MQTKHAAHPVKALYRRITWALDKPITGAGNLIAGGFLGLIMALLTMYCYFG